MASGAAKSQPQLGNICSGRVSEMLPRYTPYTADATDHMWLDGHVKIPVLVFEQAIEQLELLAYDHPDHDPSRLIATVQTLPDVTLSAPDVKLIGEYWAEKRAAQMKEPLIRSLATPLPDAVAPEETPFHSREYNSDALVACSAVKAAIKSESGSDMDELIRTLENLKSVLQLLSEREAARRTLMGVTLYQLAVVRTGIMEISEGGNMLNPSDLPSCVPDLVSDFCGAV